MVLLKFFEKGTGVSVKGGSKKKGKSIFVQPDVFVFVLFFYRARNLKQFYD